MLVIILLLGTFALSVGVCAIVARFFREPVNRIMNRLVGEDLGGAWQRYVAFALYVVGISGGVKIWELERYMPTQGGDAQALTLDATRMVLELYRTVLGTLQGIAWMLLLFFVFTLIAYVILRGFELRKGV